MKTALAAFIAFLLLFGTPGAALGQAAGTDSAAGEVDPDARKRALELFEQSEIPYREGRFDEAARLLEQAHALHPEPVLLYNLARAYEGMGESEKAIDAYRRFLQAAPKAKDRGAIERRIETLQKQIADQERLEAERERLQAERQRRDARVAEPRAEPASAGPGIWPYVTAGAGLAIVGAGFGFGALAESKQNEADEDPEHRSSRETFRQAETFATTANVLFIAGGLVTAGGITWIVLARSSEPEQASLTLGVGPGSVAVGGRF